MLSMQAVTTTFYVNPASKAANDENAGTDPAAPWASLNPTKWVDGSIVMLSPGVHSVLATAAVTANVTLQGSSKSDVIIEGLSEDDIARGSESPQFFKITGSITLTVNDVTLRNFSITTNTANLWGGMFNVSPASTLTLKNVDIKNASLPVCGGAAIHSEGTLNLTNVLFENCLSANGAALSIKGSGVTTLDNVTFRNNSTDEGTAAHKYGGAICVNSQTAVVNINNSYFDSNRCTNDISNPGANYPVGGAIAFRVAAGCNAKLHITNSTFSKNFAAWEGGAIMIDKIGDSFNSVGNVDFLFSNNTFIENYVNATHGQAFAIGGPNDINMQGSISFVNNTFMHNAQPVPTSNYSSIFINSLGTSLNYINNIMLDQVWNAASKQFFGWGFVITNDVSNFVSPTFKGNVGDSAGGDIGTVIYNQWIGADNSWTFLDPSLRTNAVDSVLTIPTTGVPYLKISNVNSGAVSRGINEFNFNGVNIVPSLDVRGSAIYGTGKDAGAYEYNPSITSINNIISKATMFAYPNPFKDIIYLHKDVANISVYDLAGNKKISAANVSQVNVANLETGLYIVRIVDTDGTVFNQKMQK